MNFTSSPFEKMMKEVPRPGRGGGEPCDGCRDRYICGGQPRRCRKKFRALIVEPSKTSDNRAPAKSYDFVGKGGTTERTDFGPSWPEVTERSLGRRGPKC